MRLILADDHTLVRAGIRALLDRIDGIETVAETGDGRAALELIEKHRPDLALLDISMPGLNGLEVATRIPSASPSTRVLLLSVHATESFVAKALRAGVAGYLLKDSAATELELAIRAVAGGKTYLSPAISMRVVEGYLQNLEAGRPTDALATVSVRQREILQLVAEGKTTREIAGLLDISVKTVEGHRAQLMDRLDIRDVPGLVRLAIREGLVSLDP